MKKDFAPLLLGKDLRSVARTGEVVRSVEDQETFDELFNLMLHHERLLVMRTADAIEKISAVHPEFLDRHKRQLLILLKSALHKELKWHIAALVTRVELSPDELKEVWGILNYWTQNRNESKIVRVNALQGLFDLSLVYPHLKTTFDQILHIVERENIPSLQARIRKLRKVRP